MGGEVTQLKASSSQIQSLAWSNSSLTLFVGAEVNVLLEQFFKTIFIDFKIDNL